MRNIKIENVTKRYEGEIILDTFNLTIPSGKFFALLGPSGCGKTTLLRLIAGFERVDTGKIYLGSDDITDQPINKRKVNTVFQNYALFPHMTVFENVAYSQVIKGLPAKDIKEKVHKILSTVNMHTHVSKSIKQLSGGQQQRVALARAIINEPEVLLLDEPLAALDVKLREKVLVELIDLQEKLQTTFVYVTHDQLEALAVADQLAIMNDDGQIEQIGSPKQIYEFPASSFVARFVGTTNFLEGVLKNIDSEPVIDIKGLGVFSIDTTRATRWIHENKSALIGLRPEKILISARERHGFSVMTRGIVESIVYNGRSTQYNVRLKNGSKLQVFEQNDEHFTQDAIDYDSEVFLYWQKENCMLFDA